MNWKAVCIALAIVLIVGSASAAVTSFPDEVTLYELPGDITITVKNNTPSKQPLEVELYMPIEYEFVEKPLWVKANSSEDVVVKLMPSADLTGLSYESSAIISVGSDTTEKEFTLDFMPVKGCPVELSIKEGSSGTGQTYTVEMRNPSVVQAYLEFKGIKGLPAGWAYSIDKTKAAVNAGGYATREIELTPGNPFSGTATASFACEGHGTIEADFEVKHEGASWAAGFAGLADLNSIIGAAGFSFFENSGIDLGLGAVSAGELMLDVLLALIVVALILALALRKARKARK